MCGQSVSSLLNRLLQRDSRNLKIRTLPAKTKSSTGTNLSHLSSNRLKRAVSILFSSTEPVPFSLYARLFPLCSLNGASFEAPRDAKELFNEMLKREPRHLEFDDYRACTKWV
ncbi:hypothetical protein RJ641_029493 [Dillenia turbinata]|uniref:Uncharacterized protein n=1 Tax=Dillenia turbinata TaxID=194707 RepID=A0AAN8ZJI7_9MAGN